MKCWDVAGTAQAVLALTLFAISTTGASAEESDRQGSANANDRSIVVTGTRLDALKEAQNTVVITSWDQSELAASSPATLADALRVQPQIVPGGGSAVGGGTVSGQNFLNLRGLGTDRTLVLVDGLRFIPGGPNGQTDVNLIPEGLVSRVDVVTGGASAAYGADAVAGVVNFTLDTAFTGLRLKSYSGISQRGDNRDFKVLASAGFSALDGRLHVVVDGEHYDNGGVLGTSRSFRRESSGQIQNPATGPTFIRATDQRTPYTLGGLVVVGQGGDKAANARISGLMFDPGGGTSPYDYGRNATDRFTANGTQDGGDGFRASTGQDIIRPLRRNLVFGHATFAVTDGLSLVAEGTWSKNRSVFANSPNLATVTISRSNPFLTAAAPALVQQMDALGVKSFTLNRLIYERGATVTTDEYEASRWLVGSRWQTLGLKWSAFYQQSRNVVLAEYANNLIRDNLTRAVDVATNPATGQPICADLLSRNAAIVGAAAGCAPFNPFGFGSPSAAALDYVAGTGTSRSVTTLQVFDANVTGNARLLPAGPLQFSAGFSARRQRSSIDADQRANDGGWRVANITDFAGHDSVREFFAEVQVPLLHGVRLAQDLDLSVAARHTDYSTSGGVETWKAGVNWRPSAWLRLRATRSRDIRAPNLDELFASGRQRKVSLFDSLSNQTYNNLASSTFGNPDLQPEIAKTWVAGMELQPLSSLSLSVEYWSIEIGGAIRTMSPAQTVEQCNLSGQTSPFCSLVTRDPATLAITAVTVAPINLSSQAARGVDFQARWDVPAGLLLPHGDGALSLRALATYTIENRVSSPLVANPVDDAGNLIAQGAISGSDIASIPRFRANLSVNYQGDSFGVFLLGRYIGAFTWDKTKVLGVDTDFNHIPAQFYLDAEFTARIGLTQGNAELFVNVANLLDHQPPYAPVPGNSTPLPTQPVLYDQIGRMFRLGVRLRY